MTDKKIEQLQIILTRAHRDFEDSLQRRAFFKVNDRFLSDDLVQNTFLKTWKYLVSGGDIDTMKYFLYNVLNNLIIDEYRKRKNTSLEILLEKGFDPSADNSQTMFDVLDGKVLVILIDYLPKKHRQVLNLRYVQDYSIEEIAKITGQTRNTVTVQAHRGLEQLKVLYKEHK